jgi:glycosyltransferase involved in cell wall biosynthesis
MAIVTITIVIPSLNQGAFLEDAIRSVLDQQQPAVELIVIDGGSTDGSLSVIQRHADRLAYWVSEKDGGPAEALNKGFTRATGEILGFLNADDFLLPGSLAAVRAAFSAMSDADVISGHGYFALENGRLAVPIYSDRWDLEQFAYGTCVLVQPATFFRRAAFTRAGGFRETGRVCWDMELWADLAKTDAKFRSVHQFWAAFRLHPGSLTVDPGRTERRRLDARAVMAEVRNRPESSADRRRHLIHRLLKFLRHPFRTIRQRLFFLAKLNRWSL